MTKSTPIRHAGNDNLFFALEMSLLATVSGTPLHVHAEGLRGTGKTTVMRWTRESLPLITRIKGCQYQCDPENPHCPLHAALSQSLAPSLCHPPGTGATTAFEVEQAPMPFVEIGHGAKLGTVLGSIDLSRLTDRAHPAAAILPGAIPMANRGIMLVDEINRLAETAPEITDVLLSVMGTKPGRVKIEEVGLPPSEIDVTASVWAASNPDEDPGPLEDIRKQLADRFDLVVPVQRPTETSVVERLLNQKRQMGPRREGQMGSRSEVHFIDLEKKAAALPDIAVPSPIVRYMAQLYVQKNVESLRAIEALELASRLSAAINGESEVGFQDVLAVIPLVFRHRVEPAALSEILKDLELRKAAGTHVKAPPGNSTGPGGSTGLSDLRARASNESGNDAADRSSSGFSDDTDGTAGAALHRSAACDDRNDPHGNSSDPAGKAGERSSGWFQRLMARYSGAANSAHNSSGASNRQGSEPGTQASSLSDPKRTPPISPPEPARPLNSIGWEELVCPPDWKDGPR